MKLTAELVHQIYESAEQEGGLSSLAQTLVRLFESDLLHLMLLDKQLSPVLQAWGAADAQRDVGREVLHYLQGWKERDPRFEQGLSKSGLVLSDVEEFEPHAFERSAFYNEFLRSLGQRYSLFTTTPLSQGSLVGLALMRPERQGYYQKQEKQLLEQLVPHVGRAMRLRALFDQAYDKQQALERVLHRLPFYLFLLDAQSRVHWLNAAAEDLLAREEGMRWEGKRLSTLRASDAAQLHQAVAELSDLCTQRAPRSELLLSSSVRALSFLRKDGQAGSLSLFPLLSGSALRSSVPQALVLCVAHQPTEQPLFDLLQLRDTYGLTPTEAELAHWIAAGRSIQEFSQERSVSVETVRTHMKRILQKSGMPSQAAFVSDALLRIAFRMRPTSLF